MMGFPNTDFSIPSVISTNLFERVRQIASVRIYLHHSHVTGRILGFAHDFCNWKAREKYYYFTCFTHKCFGFDFHFMLKEIYLSLWKTKDLSIGGNPLDKHKFCKTRRSGKICSYS